MKWIARCALSIVAVVAFVACADREITVNPTLRCAESGKGAIIHHAIDGDDSPEAAMARYLAWRVPNQDLESTRISAKKETVVFAVHKADRTVVEEVTVSSLRTKWGPFQRTKWAPSFTRECG